METRAHYAAVGAFVLTMIVLAFAAVLWLARGELTDAIRPLRHLFQRPGDRAQNQRGGRIQRRAGRQGGSEVRIDPDNVELIRVTVDHRPERRDQDRRRGERRDQHPERRLVYPDRRRHAGGGAAAAEAGRALRGDPLAPLAPGERHGARAAAARKVERHGRAGQRAARREEPHRAWREPGEFPRFHRRPRRPQQGPCGTRRQRQRDSGAPRSFIDNVDKSYAGPDGLGKQLSTAASPISTGSRRT